MEEAGDEAETFEPAPLETEADLKGNVRTMARKLDQFLFLVVQDRQGRRQPFPDCLLIVYRCTRAHSQPPPPCARARSPPPRPWPGHSFPFQVFGQEVELKRERVSGPEERKSGEWGFPRREHSGASEGETMRAVGDDGYRSPSHRTHFDPSFLELDSVL